MKRLLLANTVLLIFLLASCAEKASYERQADGIVVRFANPESGQAKLLRLQVVSDDIVRVTASPRDTFSTEKSLVVLPGLKASNEWQLEERENEVTLVTPSLRTRVLLGTGEVIFA